MKKVLKFISYTFLGIVLLIGLAAYTVYLYQEHIIDLFIKESNKHLNTPVQVAQVKLSLFDKFPNVSISFQQVYVQESYPNSSAPLAQAGMVYATFGIWEMLKGDYRVNRLYIEDASINLKINKNGEINYDFLKKTGEEGGGAINFDLEKILLEKVSVRYFDEGQKVAVSLFTDDIEATLRRKDANVEIKVKGDVLSERIQYKEDSYFSNKLLLVDARLNYHLEKQKLDILPSNIQLRNSDFAVSGFVDLSADTYIKLKVDGQNTSFQTLLSLLPEKFNTEFNKYKSQGEVYFQALIDGYPGGKLSPLVEVKFGSKNASFFHPEYSEKLEEVNFEGFFSNGSKRNMQSTELALQNLNFKLRKELIQGNVFIRNFDDHQLKLDLKGKIDADGFMKFYRPSQVKKATGILAFNVSLDGRLNDLKSAKTTSRVKTAGDVSISGFDLELNELDLPLRQMFGNFIFKSTDLAISDFRGYVGNSHFVLNGFFRNILAYLLIEGQSIGIEADLISDYLDVDELLSGESQSTAKGPQSDKSHSYDFEISPRIDLSFDCKVKRLTFQRFEGKQISGKLRVVNQTAVGSNIKAQAGGGAIQMYGRVDARNPQLIKVQTENQFDKIYIDSLFYIFENFGQDFLTDKHLKGLISAKVETYMEFDQQLNFKSDRLIADIDALIVNGELNNFEPMQALSRFVESESLSKLRFAELKNRIHIQDRTIVLPEMEIRSNVYPVSIQGIHTFDQQIDYRVKIPLVKLKRRDKDSAFGAVESDGTNVPQILLVIKGTTDDFKVSYDTQAARAKLKDDIRKEGQELKDAFKNKGKKEEKEIEISEEEYIDW